jgi:hypothetical protein
MFRTNPNTLSLWFAPVPPAEGEYPRAGHGYGTRPETRRPREVVVARNSGMAVASLVLGIIAAVGLVITWVPVLGWLSFAPAVLAVIFGGIALAQINRDPAVKGTGMAVAGLALGIVAALVGLMFRIMWAGA